jgi:hypothetical protein
VIAPRSIVPAAESLHHAISTVTGEETARFALTAPRSSMKQKKQVLLAIQQTFW